MNQLKQSIRLFFRISGTIVSVFCVDFFSLMIYAALFGFTIGAYVGLTSVILVDLLGLDKLTNAFGLLLLFQGIATFIGMSLIKTLYSVIDKQFIPIPCVDFHFY